MSKPIIGRIVHFVLAQGANAGAHRPAMIVNVLEDDKCALTVFPAASHDGLGHVLCIARAAESILGEPGTWHWPEKEEVATGGNA